MKKLTPSNLLDALDKSIEHFEKHPETWQRGGMSDIYGKYHCMAGQMAVELGVDSKYATRTAIINRGYEINGIVRGLTNYSIVVENDAARDVGDALTKFTYGLRPQLQAIVEADL
ncbi:MAG: hypothetical protein ACTHJR_12290 [Sphingomonas sp.]|uniref:hypothetical protein n=1 Tax=Sphingomonas sp. TaxID=28214 RepID=UPI003F7FC731